MRDMMERKSDINLRDLFDKEIGEEYRCPGERKYGYLALPEFGGMLRNENGVSFMVATSEGKKKNALHVYKMPQKVGKVAKIAVSVGDIIYVCRSSATNGILSTVFYWSILRVTGYKNNDVIAKVIDKNKGGFLPNTYPELAEAAYRKFKQKDSMPLYCNRIIDMLTSTWGGFDVIDDYISIDDTVRNVKPKDRKEIQEDLIFSLISNRRRAIIGDFKIVDEVLNCIYTECSVHFRERSIVSPIRSYSFSFTDEEIADYDLLLEPSLKELKIYLDRKAIKTSEDKYRLVLALR